MDLDELIYWKLYNYPTLYKDRCTVLHCLYCVIGNGYEWANGRLEGDLTPGRNKGKRTEDDARFLVSVKYQMSYIYPLSEYSCMATVPDDVKPDYLTGALDAILMVLDTPSSYGYDENERHRNIIFAEKVLQDLTQRFNII